MVALAIAVGCHALAMMTAAYILFGLGCAIECVGWALAIRRLRAA